MMHVSRFIFHVISVNFGVASGRKTAIQTFIYSISVKGAEAKAMSYDRRVSGTIGNIVAPEPRVRGALKVPTRSGAFKGVSVLAIDLSKLPVNVLFSSGVSE